MTEITANEIKTKGISAIDKIWNEGEEAVITVKGKKKYVVIPIEKYNRIRELELEQAVQEVMKDYAEGKYITDINKHIAGIFDV